MRYSIFALLLLFIACAAPEESKKEPTNKSELSLLDSEATTETKVLYENLWRVRNIGTMVGHHESLLYGRNWINEPQRSDVKDVCGDFPAVCSLDFAKIEHGSAEGINHNLKFSDIRRVTQEAYSRGEVITYCWHLDNPLTGGTSWDNSDTTVVREILKEGSPTHIKFKKWLDNLAAFAKTLTDDKGQPIPIIFRPFHEHTQTWNWWGKKCTTEQEFIAFWRFTVDYLKNEKDIHHFIYSISPQMDAVQPKEDILYRWPGDDYVDVLGMDCYHGTNTNAFKSNLKNMAAIAEEKKMPFGVTETGLEGIWKDNGTYAEYWENEMLEPLTNSKASFVIFWRNEYDPEKKRSHFFGPFPKHESSESFVKLYKSPATLFSKDLPAMYELDKTDK